MPVIRFFLFLDAAGIHRLASFGSLGSNSSVYNPTRLCFIVRPHETLLSDIVAASTSR